MVAEYADTFQRFTVDQLKAGISAIIQGRKERSWPTPAEIIEFTNRAPGTRAIAGDKPESFAEKLKKRDQVRHDAEHRLAMEFERDQAGLFRMAREEGWESILRRTVRDAASMIAKRIESRALGRKVEELVKTHDGDIVENVRCVDGQDWIVIREEDIKLWRKWNGLGEPAAA